MLIGTTAALGALTTAAAIAFALGGGDGGGVRAGLAVSPGRAFGHPEGPAGAPLPALAVAGSFR